jgi:ribosomal protein L40E
MPVLSNGRPCHSAVLRGSAKLRKFFVTQRGETKMAIAKCRECGAEVSDSAKTCPKCGIAKPVKKTSLLVKLLLGLFVLGVIGQIIGGGSGSSGGGGSVATTPAAATPAKTPKEEAFAALEIKKLNWYKGGFDNVMLVDVKFQNNGKRNVKDIELECVHFSNSGTRIDSNKKVIYEVVPAGKPLSVKEFSMGFIHTQAATTNCTITDVVVM